MYHTKEGRWIDVAEDECIDLFPVIHGTRLTGILFGCINLASVDVGSAACFLAGCALLRLVR